MLLCCGGAKGKEFSFHSCSCSRRVRVSLNNFNSGLCRVMGSYQALPTLAWTIFKIVIFY